MKKISLITIHVGANFGSILQTIASVRVFEKLGYSTQIVNYIPKRVTIKGHIFKSRSVFSIILNILKLPNKIYNDYIYQKYLKKFVTLSKPIYSSETLTKKKIEADIYVTGSDQVWNSSHNQGIDTHYFFCGLPKNVKKIAYASSFGKINLDASEQNEIKNYLASYQAISVREDSAVRILHQMGLEGQQLIDPTFMLNMKDWESFMSERLISDDYILIYTPYNTIDESIIFKTAKKISAHRNLKIITFSWTFLSNSSADYTVKYCNPGDFMSLFKYATYIITNSFHGTAFSINFNKQFWVYMPSGYTTRILSLLELSNLKNRVLNDVISNDEIQSIIEYSSINEKIDIEREKAFSFLNRYLN